MNCHNHPDVLASATCAGCAEPFCADCVVNLRGAVYCGSCKTMAVTTAPPPALIPCQEANTALKYAIVGIFCFGIVCGPYAISKALTARKLIAANPSLSGKGRADAALVIGIVVTALWALGMYARARQIR